MSRGASADQGEDAPLATNTGPSQGHVYHVRLEKDSVSGGKFWEAWADGQELRLAWGKLNSSGQVKSFRPDQCASHSPTAELTIRAAKKQQEGYRVVAGHI